MSRWRVWVGGAIGVAVLLAGFVLWWPRRPAPEPAAPAPPSTEATGTVKFLKEQQWAIRLKHLQAQPGSVARQVTATGRVVPAAGRHAVVAPPVAGLLTGTQLPRVGQAVTRGQTVVVIRQMPTAAEQAQIAAGQAQVWIEQARLDAERRRLAEAVPEAAVRRDHARIEFERAQRLYERKAYSLRQLQAAEAEYRTAESAYAATVAQREALREPQAGGPTNLANLATSYPVPAPIAGTVVKVAKSLGEQVGAGETILEIVDLDPVWVEVPVPERDLARLARDIRAVFTTPGAPEQEFSGRLIDVGAVINPETRAATVRFEVSNPRRVLRIGMQAEVRLEAGERVEALLLPKEAVQEAEGKRFVYVLVTGEEFQRREVTLGDEHGDRVAVLSGLKPGERVVTQGAYQLRQHELRPSAPGAHTHET